MHLFRRVNGFRDKGSAFPAFWSETSLALIKNVKEKKNAAVFYDYQLSATIGVRE